jgi:hypothetical protein
VALRERARPRGREAADVFDIAANGWILAASAVHKTYPGKGPRKRHFVGAACPQGGMPMTSA